MAPTTKSAAKAATGTSDPKRTVYIRGLNEKVKLEELKKALYGVMSQFGGILEVHARKTLKTRGQAWVVFQDVTSAANAVRNMEGFVFYEKPMTLSFASSDGDAVSRMLGTYKPRPRRPKGERDRLLAKAQEDEAKKAAAAAGHTAGAASGGAYQQDQQTQQQQQQQQAGPNEVPPNKILLLINLPADCDEKRLQTVFGQLPGLKEVRLIPNRHDVAFIEYENEYQSTQAKNSLQGYMIGPEHPMKIMFAKSAN